MVTSEQLPLFHRTICVLTDDSRFHCGEKSPCFRRAVTELSGGGGGSGMIPALALEMNHLFSSSEKCYRVL